jgi:fermentation-respiration switch protein FrsA (DUF1100 family)
MLAPLRLAFISCALAFPALAQDYSVAGPYGAGWTTVTVARPNGTTFTARFTYPATGNGQGQPFQPSGAPYPAISFGHGFQQPASAYQATYSHFASWGYFVIATESENTFFPSHQNFANDLRHSLTWLEQQDGNPASPWYKRIDTLALALSGHSMGGGASILAAAVDNRVSALANFAAAETNPSAVAAIPNVTCPISLISGSADTVVPVSSNGQLMFNAARAPKILPSITGGFHCGFVDTPSFGGFGCDSGTITKAVQMANSRRLAVEFFELNLRGRQDLWKRVWGETMKLDPALSVQSEPFARVTPFAQRVPTTPGVSAVFTFDVQNTAPYVDSLDLLVEGLPWPYTLSASSTGPLLPGASVQLQCSVQVPAGTAPGLQRFALSARRASDGATRAYGLRGVRIL